MIYFDNPTKTELTNKFFSVNIMTAKSEAQRAVTLELAEANIRPLPAEAQKQIADKLLAPQLNEPKKKQNNHIRVRQEKSPKPYFFHR